MTNYEPVKNRMWDAAKNGDRSEFDRQCELLKEKAEGDWWRIGWNFYPKTAEELVEILEEVAKAANECWVKAMECGDAPSEDVSPGESFQRCAELVKKLMEGKTEK